MKVALAMAGSMRTRNGTLGFRGAGEAPLNIGVYGARGIPSTYSGYETFLSTLLPELVERGHRVTMYCRQGLSDSAGDYRGVRRRTLPALQTKQLGTLSHGLVASVRARAAAHDVLLVVNVANALYCGLSRYTGQPVVLNVDGQEWLRGKWSGAAQRFFRLSAAAASRCATALIADSEAMAAVYRDEFGARSTVIPYCFPRLERTLDHTAPARQGVVPGRYFIIAGRLVPENNIDGIVEAYTSTSLEHPLLVLGEANYASPVTDRLRKAAASDRRIRLVGHVEDRAEFLTLIGSAAGYIHGHSVGGTNPSLIEAMGAGALVAAYDTPFSRETLGDAGGYFDTVDPYGVGQALKALLAAPPREQDALRARAVRRVSTRYDLPSVVDAHEALLRTAAAQRPRRASLRSMSTRWRA